MAALAPVYAEFEKQFGKATWTVSATTSEPDPVAQGPEVSDARPVRAGGRLAFRKAQVR
jgi:hypothetical protein